MYDRITSFLEITTILSPPPPRILIKKRGSDHLELERVSSFDPSAPTTFRSKVWGVDL